MADKTFNLEACFALSKSSRVEMAITAARQIIESGPIVGGPQMVIIERPNQNDAGLSIKAKHDFNTRNALQRLRAAGWVCGKVEKVMDVFGMVNHERFRATPPSAMRFFFSDTFAGASESFMNAAQQFAEYDALTANSNAQNELTVAFEIMVMLSKPVQKRTKNLAFKRLGDFYESAEFKSKHNIERMIAVMMSTAEMNPHLMQFTVVYGSYSNLGYEAIGRQIATHLVPSALSVSVRRLFYTKTAFLSAVTSVADTAMFRSLGAKITRSEGL